MDFVSDSLFNGRRIRVLSVVDNFSRECLAIHVDHSIKANKVVGVMQALKRFVGRVPERIQVDNDAEFISKTLDKWVYENGVVLDFSRPGKPIDNAYIESFNGSFRDECLNTHWFMSLDDAREKIETWRRDYNGFRPRSALDNMTPEEYVERKSKKSQKSLIYVVQLLGEVQKNRIFSLYLALRRGEVHDLFASYNIRLF